jgi:dihydropteroate synthase
VIAFKSGLPNPASLRNERGLSIYCIPRGLVSGPLARYLVKGGHALPFLGVSQAFAAVEVITHQEGLLTRYGASVAAFEPWRQVLHGEVKSRLSTFLDFFSSERLAYSDLDLNVPKIMGVVNVTPDSFSDGGDHDTVERAIAHGVNLAEEGADILDVGGESTRPGATQVSPETEQQRVLPVVRALSSRGFTVSIDTRHASTMAAAIEAGAKIVNDVTALTGDSAALGLVRRKKCCVVLMHMQGAPKTMQEKPRYTWAPMDVFDYLEARVQTCIDAGIDRGKICIDPGIGFGKTDDHNLDLLKYLSILHGVGCPIMLGASRKSFIGRVTRIDNPKARLPGSLAVALAGIRQGAQIIRVHDVAETHQAILMLNAVQGR